MTSHQTFLSHKRKTQHKSYYYTLARSHENYAPFLLSTTAKILYLELNFLFHGYKPSKRKEGKKKTFPSRESRITHVFVQQSCSRYSCMNLCVVNLPMKLLCFVLSAAVVFVYVSTVTEKT